jgi:hypothetical protein
MVAPPYPELFASGCFINGPAGNEKWTTETVIEIIKAYDVKVVLVIDNEKLENDVRNYFAGTGVIILQVPKSGGATPQRVSDEDKVIYNKY